MRIMIDSPVSLYNTPDEIRAWLRRVDEMAAEHPDDQSLQDVYAQERENTLHSLSIAEAIERGEIPRPIDLDA